MKVKALKLWVTAIKDIKKGEELTCDYGFSYDSDYKQFPCKCGSKIVLVILCEKAQDGELIKNSKKFKELVDNLF